MRYKRLLCSGLITFFVYFSAMCAAKITVEPEMTASRERADWIKGQLGKMTLAEKAGQLIACRLSGRFVNRESGYLRDLKAMVEEQGVGGFCLFGGNVYETAVLTNALQRSAKIPLLIASDLERGLGNQIDGSTLFPPAMAIGAAHSEELAYSMGKITALEARAIGIHMTYAPVADVNTNPDNPIISVRSFGEDPEQVSRLAISFIKGCQENGLIATAKHFPGHGDTGLDSHIVPQRVEADRERLEKVELFPFKKSVEDGVKAIMVAHLLVPALDPTPLLPASLSYKILTEYLRRELGFEGLIVTDAMDMGGVTALYSPEEAAVLAVQAGVDMVLLSPKPKEAIGALVQAVRSGAITEKRLDESVQRILKMKSELGLHRKKLVDLNMLDKVIASPSHLEQAALAFENSMTLVKNEQDIIPVCGTGKRLAVLSLSSDPGDYFAGEAFATEVQRRYPEAYIFYSDAYTGQEYLDEAQKSAQDADLIVVGLFSRVRSHKGNVGLNPRHIQLIHNLAALPKPLVVISFGSPYFLRHFPEVDAYLCAYRYASEAQKAAAKAIFGDIDIQGQLPVSILGLYLRGSGLMIPKVKAGK